MSTLTLGDKEWAVYMTGVPARCFMAVCADCACLPAYDLRADAYEWQDKTSRYVAPYEMLADFAARTDEGDYAPPPYGLDLFHGFHRIELPLRTTRYIFHSYPDATQGGG